MTEVLQPSEVGKAIQIVKNGGLVAFPTETVYGLGANARDGLAVRKVFSVKQRPLTNPLHVNIADFSQVSEFVEEISPVVQRVMKAFLPGPLTVILPLKMGSLPEEVTAGLKTVGIRMPVNEFALELIRGVGVMVGPSANLSGKRSPISVAGVLADLDGKIKAVLDGGECVHGVESTILDVSKVNCPRILRHGAIPAQALREFFPTVQ